MFKIKNEISKNPNEKLLIIKKIINLQRQQLGGSIELSGHSIKQLETLNDKLYNQHITNETTVPDNNKLLVELLNKINIDMNESNVDNVKKHLYTLEGLLQQDTLKHSKLYTQNLETLLIEVNMNGLSPKMKENIHRFMNEIIQDPTMADTRQNYIQPDSIMPPLETLKSTSSQVPDPVPVIDSKDTAPSQTNYEYLKDNYLSEIEQQLVNMLLHTIGLKKLNTWDKISEKYKVLYNILIFGDDNSIEDSQTLFRYSYNDIAFVQTLINFNHYGLINWETATKNIKMYVNDLVSVLKGTPMNTSAPETNSNIHILNKHDSEQDSEQDSENESDSEEDIQLYDKK